MRYDKEEFIKVFGKDTIQVVERIAGVYRKNTLPLQFIHGMGLVTQNDNLLIREQEMDGFPDEDLINLIVGLDNTIEKMVLPLFKLMKTLEHLKRYYPEMYKKVVWLMKDSKVTKHQIVNTFSEKLSDLVQEDIIDGL